MEAGSAGPTENPFLSCDVIDGGSQSQEERAGGVLLLRNGVGRFPPLAEYTRERMMGTYSIIERESQKGKDGMGCIKAKRGVLTREGPEEALVLAWESVAPG